MSKALLQEHGDFVLRFLAEDVSKHPDTLLDAFSDVVPPSGPKPDGDCG